MSIKSGRRETDVDPDLATMEKWTDVLRQARVALLGAVTNQSLPDGTTVELRFDKEVEEQLIHSLGKIVLRRASILEVVERLQEVGRVELAHIAGSTGTIADVYLLKPPRKGN